MAKSKIAKPGAGTQRRSSGKLAAKHKGGGMAPLNTGGKRKQASGGSY